MKKTLKEISELVDGKLNGDTEIIVTGVGNLESAKAGQISFIKDKSYLDRAKRTNASALIVPSEIEGQINISHIVVDNPYLAFNKILMILNAEKKNFYKGIHPTAILGKETKVANNVSIGPYSVIGNNVFLEEETVICSNVYLGDRVTIGKNCLIYPNVSIREDTTIGDRVIIHCGTVIGSDGFGYISDKEEYIKIPQIGCVIIEDDVEIGANVTIDRATINKTLIGKGTKIDNLVHIAHNVTVGENSVLLAHVTIAGSTKIGKHVILSGQTGVTDNLNVGDNVVAGARTGIIQDVPANSVVWGLPAIPVNEQKKISVILRSLPEIAHQIKELTKKIKYLEDQILKSNAEKTQ